MIPNFTILNFTIVNLILYFSIYSFLGWCLETTFATIKNKKFTNRGFLHGPFCPMYGLSVVLVILIAKPIEDNYLTLYLVCFFGASIVEYLTGFILETLFQTKWWDYSNQPLNLQGRICVLFSLIWGIAGIFVLKVLHPLVNSFVTQINNLHLSIIFSRLLFIYLLSDFIVTLIKLFQLKSLLFQLYDVSLEVKNTLINLKIVAYDKVTSVSNKSKDKFSEAEFFSKDFWNKREVIEEIPKELKEKYDTIVDKIASRYSRVFIAFPQLSSKKFKKSFSDIREKIKSKVR